MTCVHCGVEFTGRKRKFCSNECCKKESYAYVTTAREKISTFPYAQWPQERKERWEAAWSSDWGMINLARLIRGVGRGEAKGEIDMAMSVTEVKCMDCRIEEEPAITEVDDQAEEINVVPEEVPKVKRGRKPAKKSTVYGAKDITLESLIELHNQGLTTKEMSKRLECSDTNVRSRLRKAGLEPLKSIGKNGGNGKVKDELETIHRIPVLTVSEERAAPQPVELVESLPPSPVEAVFTELKKSKVERLKELLLSFTVAELLEAEKTMGVKDLFENVTALAQDLANGKKVPL